MTSLVSDVRIAPPDTVPGSARNRSRQGGRKLVNPDGDRGVAKEVRPVDISDIDELQKILDRDADAILNMKRDITNAQKAEFVRAQAQLLKSQKDYDMKKIDNKRKAHALATLLDQEKELERLQSVRGSQGSANEATVERLKEHIATVEEKLAADKRTFGVMGLMYARTQHETEQLRSESQLVSQQLEIKKTELLGLNSTIRSSRQELIEEEKRYEELVRMVKNRAVQRVEKMGQLQSLLLLNGSFEDTSVPVAGVSIDCMIVFIVSVLISRKLCYRRKLSKRSFSPSRLPAFRERRTCPPHEGLRLTQVTTLTEMHQS